MHVTTAATAEAAGGPERGRALARLQADLEALDRLEPGRPTARQRLRRDLGAELAERLVHALSSGAGRAREVRAA